VAGVNECQEITDQGSESSAEDWTGLASPVESQGYSNIVVEIRPTELSGVSEPTRPSVRKRPVCPSFGPDGTDGSTRKCSRDGPAGLVGVLGGATFRVTPDDGRAL